MMGDDPLRAAVLSLLGRRPSAALRRQIAERLRALADEQEAIASAEARNAAAGGKLAPRAKSGGRPRGTGATFVRVEAAVAGHSGRIHVGRALWQQLGEPRRLDVQRLGGTLVLRPVRGGAGYALTRPRDGMPRLSLGDEALTALGLVAGRYNARIEAGAIVADVD